MTKTPRLNRLFSYDGKCFDVALDHGFFNELSFLRGIEDLPAAVRILAEAGPDAIQLSPGQAPALQDLPGKAKPSLVLRTDVANVYGSALPAKLFSQLADDAVGQALALDAACVVVNLLLLPGQPDLHRQCVENVSRLRALCSGAGMPLMVEPLVMRDNAEQGGYQVDGDLNKILPLVRQAVELGADIIKADPCTDIGQYNQVIRVASGVPVLVRGGGRTTDAEILKRTELLMAQGAKGIVYGRNVIQHPDPAGMCSALMAVVHQGITAEAALGMIKGAGRG